MNSSHQFAFPFPVNLPIIQRSELKEVTPIEATKYAYGCGSGTLHDIAHMESIVTYQGLRVAVKDFKEMPDKFPIINTQMENASQLKHPNLISILGITPGKRSYGIVMEYMSKGTLDTTLNRKADPLPWSIRLNIIEDIVNALVYLHRNNNFLHGGSLRPENIYLSYTPDGQLKAKINLFGFSNMQSTSNGAGVDASKEEHCIKYQAPETFTREYSRVKFSSKSDMYSLGLLLIAITTRLPARAKYTQIEVVNQNNYFPEVWNENDVFPEGIKELIEQCCKFNPKERPTAVQALERIREIIKNYENQTLNWKANIQSWVPFDYRVHKIPFPNINEEKVFAFCKPLPEQKAFVEKCYSFHPVPGCEIESIEVINNRNFTNIFSALLGSLEGQSLNPGFNPTWHADSDQWKELVNQYYKMLSTLTFNSPASKDVGILPTWFHPHHPEVEESIYKHGYAVDENFNDYLYGQGVRTSFGAGPAMWGYHGDTLILNFVAIRSIFPVSPCDEIAGKRSVKNSFANFVPVMRSQSKLFPYEICQPFTQPQGFLCVVFDRNACMPQFKVKLRKISPEQDNSLPVFGNSIHTFFDRFKKSETMMDLENSELNQTQPETAPTTISPCENSVIVTVKINEQLVRIKGDHTGQLSVENLETYNTVTVPAHSKAITSIKVVGSSIFTFSKEREEGMKKWQYSGIELQCMQDTGNKYRRLS